MSRIYAGVEGFLTLETGTYYPKCWTLFISEAKIIAPPLCLSQTESRIGVILSGTEGPLVLNSNFIKTLLPTVLYEKQSPGFNCSFNLKMYG